MFGVKPRKFARGRVRVVGMNNTERAYSQYLDARRAAGEVDWYAYEGLKLRLADKTFYTPDFFVMLADGTLEAHEVKGHWEDDARVKIKVAAEMYPFQFIAAKPKTKRDGGGWSFEKFARGAE